MYVNYYRDTSGLVSNIGNIYPVSKKYRKTYANNQEETTIIFLYVTII